MRSEVLAVLAVVMAGNGVSAQQSAYGSGIGWSGSTSCISGYVCTVSNQYYSQCIPGTANPSTTLLTSTIIPTTTLSSPSTTISGGTGRTGYLGTTLQSGYYWIRAAESPNFHKYLQTKPEYSAGLAYLEDYITAGQFQIVSGQLVQLTASGLLYGNVIPSTTAAVKLQLAFNTTKNAFGTFSFSGDGVAWSVPSITKPNPIAWLICEDQTVWINLGNYDYMTPSGCVDETIHYYNAANAND